MKSIDYLLLKVLCQNKCWKTEGGNHRNQVDLKKTAIKMKVTVELKH